MIGGKSPGLEKFGKMVKGLLVILLHQMLGPPGLNHMLRLEETHSRKPGGGQKSRTVRRKTTGRGKEKAQKKTAEF